MAKFDEQLSRMGFLMEYKSTPKQSSTNIEYHTNGADGKVYGILREGTKYYIKSTDPGKEMVSESYNYIGGYMNKKENEFKSYNDATKHLEAKLISLNESRGIHEDVSTVDFNRNEKILSSLTEEARKELDRVNMIMENSTNIGIASNIGNHGDSEKKGSSTGENTTKNNTPFENKVGDVNLEKDTTATQSDAAKANKDYTDVSKNVEANMTSDKNKKGNNTTCNDCKDAHSDLDGTNVAEQKPKGGKVVKVNESLVDDENIIDTPIDNADMDEPYEDGEDVTDPFETADDIDGAFDGVDADDSYDTVDASEVGGDDLVGMGDDEEVDDFDMMLENFESLISGDNKVMTGPTTSNPGKSEAMKEAPTKSPVKECGDTTSEDIVAEDETQTATQGDEETMKSYKGKGTLPVQTWDKMNESIDRITEGVVSELFGKKKRVVKESIADKINRIVKEEVTKLDAWGKHPRYRQQPMTTPPNKEVLAGTADRDWNDDSAKGEQPYGSKIGSGAPFNKAVEMLTDNVLSQLKESFLKKK